MATASHSTFPFLKFSQLEIIYTNDIEAKYKTGSRQLWQMFVEEELQI